jgi:hypothetical protein
LTAPRATASAAGSRVGVDVQHLAVGVRGDGRHDGDPAGREQVVDCSGVDGHYVAHEPDVDLLAVDSGPGALGDEQAAVLTAHADRMRAVLVDQTDQLAADLPDQHHPDDVDGLGRGDPQPAAELARNSQSLQHRRHLRPAAVHDDRPDADVQQKTMSMAKARLSASSVMALPPYLMTTTRP